MKIWNGSRQCALAGALLASAFFATPLAARAPDEIIDLWEGLAPGETTRHSGTALPRRPTENPPATRIAEITRPQLRLFLPPADRRSGAAVLIFPGGAYNYVVADKEGAEAADWLNSHGVAGLVLHYRTKRKPPRPAVDGSLPLDAERPLQDGQRAVSLTRSRAAEWGLDPEKLGVLGFSAGGQAAALVTTRGAQRAYSPADRIDKAPCHVNFSLLVYPWRLVDDRTGLLREALTIGKDTPPTFLVHAHDDGATSLSSVLFYTALKRHGRPGELHVYETGGHGYGMRPVEDSEVDSWPARAADWLGRRGLLAD